MAQDFNVAPALKKHVEYLCMDEMEGRAAGSAGEKAAAGYLYDCLKQAGVLMLTERDGQDFSIAGKNGEIHSRNIVGIVEGSDPSLRNEYIVVGAHFDHLGSNVVDVNGTPVKRYYYGADDNASGVAILIELARLVSNWRFMFNRSIIFVGFGASEKGMAGSWYFVNRAFEQIGSVRAMINLDMLGRGNSNNPFSIFSQMKATDLQYLVDRTSQEPVVLSPAPAPKEITPSDHLPFYEKKIPVICFTTGKTRENRTARDLPEQLQYDDMEYACNYIYYFLKILAYQESIPRIGEEEKETPDVVVAPDEENVYTVLDCDKPPQFFHSDERHFLESWVYKYQKYPRAALKNGIQGRVQVSFIIEKDGSVTNVEVIEGVDDDIDDEAVRIVSISPKWIPGQIKGHKVRVRMIIPVEFRLTTEPPKFRIKK